MYQRNATTWKQVHKDAVAKHNALKRGTERCNEKELENSPMKGDVRRFRLIQWNDMPWYTTTFRRESAKVVMRTRKSLRTSSHACNATHVICKSCKIPDELSSSWTEVTEILRKCEKALQYMRGSNYTLLWKWFYSAPERHEQLGLMKLYKQALSWGS